MVIYFLFGIFIIPIGWTKWASYPRIKSVDIAEPSTNTKTETLDQPLWPAGRIPCLMKVFPGKTLKSPLTGATWIASRKRLFGAEIMTERSFHEFKRDKYPLSDPKRSI
jgi:hypothetical protein